MVDDDDVRGIDCSAGTLIKTKLRRTIFAGTRGRIGVDHFPNFVVHARRQVFPQSRAFGQRRPLAQHSKLTRGLRSVVPVEKSFVPFQRLRETRSAKIVLLAEHEHDLEIREFFKRGNARKKFSADFEILFQNLLLQGNRQRRNNEFFLG